MQDVSHLASGSDNIGELFLVAKCNNFRLYYIYVYIREGGGLCCFRGTTTLRTQLVTPATVEMSEYPPRVR